MFRVEFETIEQLVEWRSSLILKGNLNRRHMQDPKPPANTTITVPFEDGIRAFEYDLSWSELVQVLMEADEAPRPTQFLREGSGRYPKRVLMCTTSKERREGRRTSAY
jgi:hypothetical protein